MMHSSGEGFARLHGDSRLHCVDNSDGLKLGERMPLIADSSSSLTAVTPVAYATQTPSGSRAVDIHAMEAEVETEEEKAKHEDDMLTTKEIVKEEAWLLLEMSIPLVRPSCRLEL